MQQLEIGVDVSDAAGLGVAATVSATVVLPEPDLLPARPVICVAMPSSSYARGYYTCDLPGAGSEGAPGKAQAAFHAARGWIFVALDWLGCDGSSTIDPEDLGYDVLTAAAHAAQAEIVLRLANGVLAPGYPPVSGACVIGIGQSLGGALLVCQQARLASFDGIGVLGFSAVHSHPATPPGGAPVVVAWYPRDARVSECREPLNAAALAAATRGASAQAAWEAVAWGFHYDDVPVDVVEQDLAHYEGIARGGDPDAPSPPWYARRTPQRAARSTLTPGVVAPEAAAITVPVLCAMGERDLVPDPRGEARAYASAPGIDLFVCPRMGHVHNMAGTRALLWERIHLFGEWCSAMKSGGEKRRDER